MRIQLGVESAVFFRVKLSKKLGSLDESFFNLICLSRMPSLVPLLSKVMFSYNLVSDLFHIVSLWWSRNMNSQRDVNSFQAVVVTSVM